MASKRRRYLDGILAALDRLDVVNAAAIPMRAELRTARCSEAGEQIGGRMGRPMRGGQVVAGKGGPPPSLTCPPKEGLPRFLRGCLRSFGLRRLRCPGFVV